MPQEDRPFEAVVGLDDVDVGLASNTEVPMEHDGEPLTAGELLAVDMSVIEFKKKVRTLTAEADAVFYHDFGIKCTDAERKSASRIMDIVSSSGTRFRTTAHTITAFKARLKSQPFHPAPRSTRAYYHRIKGADRVCCTASCHQGPYTMGIRIRLSHSAPSAQTCD